MHILMHIYVSYTTLNNIFHILIEYPVAPRKVTNYYVVINILVEWP
jgi:hypothetical protein